MERINTRMMMMMMIITRKIVTINESKDNVHDDDHYWGAARWKTQRVAEHSLVGTLLFHCWLSIADDSGDEDFKIKSYICNIIDALRRPMTYDNHPIPSHPSTALKTTSHELI